MRAFINRKAQSTAEYAIVIALVIGAAIAMQVYVRRGLQGGLKFATDKLKSSDAGATGQYEPYYLQSEAETTRQNAYSSEETRAAGEVVRELGESGLAGAGERTTRASKQAMRGVADKD